MKSVILVALGVLFMLTSCVRKQVVLEVEGQRDSLATVVSQKDSLISAVFEDINSITENLAQIRSRENLITVAGEAEGVRRPVEQISNDIAAIDRLLQENKAKIASLQRAASQLRKANLRISGLEKMIKDLNVQLGDKSEEIDLLRSKLSKMGVEVKNLSQKIVEHEVQVENLSGEKVELENQLNTVYYIVGGERELRDAQIVTKEGFIGRTLKATDKGSLESFTKADSRLLSEIPIGQKKVKIVTTHPAGSFELITDADKVVRKLVITDQTRFWESSKMLIISYK